MPTYNQNSKKRLFCWMRQSRQHAYLFNYSDLGEVVFHDRKQALNKVLAAEANNKKKISKETFYEEY